MEGRQINYAGGKNAVNKTFGSDYMFGYETLIRQQMNIIPS